MSDKDNPFGGHSAAIGQYTTNVQYGGAEPARPRTARLPRRPT